ncbi:hypothetical protein GCM10027035_12040 [Emticicia sediminis]
MAAQTINSPLSESQLYMLRLMANIKEDDLVEIKKLVRKYLAQKLTKQADAVWEQNGWTAADEEQILNSHQRTPYKSQ